MSLLEISLFTAACVNICIGFYALYARPRRITTYGLFFFAVGLGVWVGSFFLLLVTHNFLFDKLNHYAGLSFIGGLLLLALTFPNKRFRARYLVIYVPLIVGAIFVAHGCAVTSDTFGPGDTVTPQAGPLFPFYAGGLILYLVACIALFGRTYRTLDSREKLRMKYLFLGILIFVLPVCVFDIGLPAIGFTSLNLIGPLMSVGFVVATFYAVIRHQLMDIRVVIQRGSIYTLLITSIYLSYIGLLLCISNLFDASMGVAATLSAGIVIIVSIHTMPRIEKYFRKVTDGLFFKDHYDYAVALEELSVIMNRNLQLALLAPRLVRALSSIFKSESLEFVHLATGVTFTSEEHRMTTEPVHPVPKDGIRINITTQDHTLGFFIFGAKRSGDPYTSEDQRLLRTFASQAAVAFSKAELYEELQNYSLSLEEKVLLRTKDIAELQEYQRELIDEISHALQTPLTVLKSAIELFKVRRGLQEVQSITSMEHSVDDLSRLVHDVLQLARIEAMEKEDHLEFIDLGALVTDVIEYVEIICQQARIHIVKHIEPNIVINGNRKQLEDVITNLLSNAVRYTASCPVRRLTIHVSQDDEHAQIRIEDTGVGMEKEVLDHIFDRFYRGQECVTDAPGYGLGLAIVKRIVERHGGTIHAESDIGKGTVFIVRFPQKSSSTQ